MTFRKTEAKAKYTLKKVERKNFVEFYKGLNRFESPAYTSEIRANMF